MIDELRAPENSSHAFGGRAWGRPPELGGDTFLGRSLAQARMATGLLHIEPRARLGQRGGPSMLVFC